MLFCLPYWFPYRTVSFLRYVTFRSLTLLIHRDRSMILAAAHVRFCSLGGITTLRTRRVVQTDDKEVFSARDAQTWFSLFCSYQNWAAWAKVTRFASNIRWFCRLYTVLQTDTERHSRRSCCVYRFCAGCPRYSHEKNTAPVYIWFTDAFLDVMSVYSRWKIK
jgi:hypothetical protein